MAAKRIYSPPLLEDVDNIDVWLREIELWKCVTELDTKQQGPAIYLSLPCNIRQACIDITVSSLNSENGLKILLDKIKSLYAKDIHSLAYIAYDKFETFHRPVEMNIVDYLNEFERLYNQIKQYDMELPTGVLAYRVLKNANITHEKQQLVRATLNSLTYENMKKQLGAIYDSSFDSTSTQTTGIKEEVFYSKSDVKNDYNKKREFKQQNY